MKQYSNFPCVPRWHDRHGTTWFTPDNRYMVFKPRDGDPEGTPCYVVSEMPEHLGNDGQWIERLRGDEMDAQCALGVILYPPGSVPSPEPHNCAGGQYGRWMTERLGTTYRGEFEASKWEVERGQEKAER